MRKRLVVVGTLVALSLTLASRVATRAWAQKNATPPLMAIDPQDKEKEVSPKKWRSPSDSQVKATESALPDLMPPPPNLKEALPANPGQVAETPVDNDPMATVDSFLQRNRKEADDSIKALNQEAEALRARLQKVEAALARWKGVANALNPLNQDANPGTPKEDPTQSRRPVSAEPSDPFLPEPGSSAPPPSLPSVPK